MSSNDRKQRWIEQQSRDEILSSVEWMRAVLLANLLRQDWLKAVQKDLSSGVLFMQNTSLDKIKITLEVRIVYIHSYNLFYFSLKHNCIIPPFPSKPFNITPPTSSHLWPCKIIIICNYVNKFINTTYWIYLMVVVCVCLLFKTGHMILVNE